MISKTDQLIIAELRKNSRKSLSTISKKTGIPVSTVFDRVKKLDKEIIERHIALIDYSKLNHNISVNFFVKVNDSEKKKMTDFLIKHDNANNVLRITNGYDFLVEGIFRDMKQIEEFNEELNTFGIKKLDYYHTVEQLKKEGFLTKKEHFD